MTIKELYEIINSSYDDVIRRIPNDELIARFLKKFLFDNSFNELKDAINKKDVYLSFEASHKLKGIVANLSFTNLFKDVDFLTEYLRKTPKEIDYSLFQKVIESYNEVIKGIEAYFND